MSAATLTDTESDANSLAGATSFTVAFNTGVVAGTTYECSVTLTTGGYTSAKSPPAIVITPDTAGM